MDGSVMSPTPQPRTPTPQKHGIQLHMHVNENLLVLLLSDIWMLHADCVNIIVMSEAHLSGLAGQP